ncbi:MAG: MFS transporter, partial [Eubacteriales bacterium]|nr:MFS transporter [Eubacteriales bacterium]
YAARLLVGLGVSVVFISLLKVQAVWFPKDRFATMTGITSLVGNFGGILATTPLALLVLAIGWQQSFITIGIVSLALVAAIWFFVLDAPENVGYTRLGEGGNGKPRFGLAESIKKVASVPGTWLNALVIAGLMGGIMSFSGLWGVPYLAQVYGFTKTQASNYVLLLNLGILLGSPVVGILADKLGSKKRLIIIGSGALTLFWVYVLIIAGAMPPVSVLAPLYFVAGFLGIVFTLCFSQVKEINHPELSGTATGFINVAGFLATALFNLIIGWRLDAGWDGAMAEGVRFYGQAGFQRAMLVLVIAAGTAFVTSLFLPESKITK